MKLITKRSAKVTFAEVPKIDKISIAAAFIFIAGSN